MYLLKRDSTFNIAAWGVRMVSNSLVGRLNHGLKNGPFWGELEMPDIPWFIVEERTQSFRKIGMLQWNFHLRLSHTCWKTYFSSILWGINLWRELRHPWRALWSVFSVTELRNQMQWEYLDPRVSGSLEETYSLFGCVTPAIYQITKKVLNGAYNQTRLSTRSRLLCKLLLHVGHMIGKIQRCLKCQCR